MTYEEFLKRVLPTMLDANGRFLGPQAGVNFAFEGMTPQQAYDATVQRYNVVQANKADNDNHGFGNYDPALLGTLETALDPTWRQGPIDTKRGALGNWGLPLAMIAAPFAAAAMGVGSTAGGAAAEGVGEGTGLASAAGYNPAVDSLAASNGVGYETQMLDHMANLGGAELSTTTPALNWDAMNAADKTALEQIGADNPGLLDTLKSGGSTALDLVKKYGPTALKALGVLGIGTKAAQSMGNQGNTGTAATGLAASMDPANYQYTWDPSTGSYTHNGTTGPDMYGANQAAHITKMAQGGLHAAATNPRFIQGPGDGLSDSVPVRMSDGGPGRLADGEFVIPADVVSGLGNGSSQAGARQLYKMMDNIRKRAHGKKQQMRAVDPNKVLPA